MKTLSLKRMAVGTLTYSLMTFYAFFLILPVFFSVMSAIRPSDEIFKYATPFTLATFIPKELTLESFRSLFVDYKFMTPLWNTVVVCVWTVILGLVFNALAGFAFAKFRFKGKKVLFTLVILTMMIPFEAIAIPLYSLCHQLNMLNTKSSLVLPAVANGTYIFLFKNAFEEIPDSLAESARMDGARWFDVFIRIYVPLTKPIMVSAGLLIFFYQWQSFVWPLIAANAPEVRVVQVALSVFQQENATLWGEIFAASVVTTILPLLFFFPLQKYYKMGTRDLAHRIYRISYCAGHHVRHV